MQKSSLFEFDPKTERTFHKLKKAKSVTNCISFFNGRRRRSSKEDSPRLCHLGCPQSNPGNHNSTSYGQEFRAQAGTHLNGPTVPVWRLVNGGSQPAPLGILEVCDTLKINWASTDTICLWLFPFSLRDKARALLHHYLRGRSRHGMISQKPSSPSSHHLARRRAWGTRAHPSLRERMSRCMRHGSDSKTCWDYAPIMVCKNGWWSRHSTTRWLNWCDPWSMRQHKGHSWAKQKRRRTTWLRKWRWTTSNGQVSVANPRGLEVSTI